jgi:hypothetical protein
VAQDERDEARELATEGSQAAMKRKLPVRKGAESVLRVDFSTRLCRILRLSDERLGPVSRTGPMRFGVCAVGQRDGVRAWLP